ncbi:MAG TPA: S8 family peptidase [Chloroflexota bacterium]|nr:S8 family peptidase [Chloroflexota bacterium]
MIDRARWILPLILVLAVFGATTASADTSVRKIVVFRDGVDEVTKHKAVKEAGGNPLKQLTMVNASVVELSAAGAAALSENPNVELVENDRRLKEHSVGAVQVALPESQMGSADGQSRRSNAKPDGSSQIVPWGVDRIKAPEAWRFSQGTGVKVAVLDSGIDLSHPDLRVAGGVNLLNRGQSYDDDRGHGTHVAGTIAARDNGQGVVGVAPGASLYAVKAIDKNGEIWASDVVQGLEWSVNNHMDVVNMSFGSPEDDPAIRKAITAAHNAGVVLVASAGNEGPAANTVHYPALYPEVIAVSAIDQENAIASFSSVGPQVALAAPGVEIYSTYLGGSYATRSGTSMAAPHVTGVVALRLQLHPGETPDQVAAALKSSVDRLPKLTSDQQGAGRVDALDAVNSRNR